MVNLSIVTSADTAEARQCAVSSMPKAGKTVLGRQHRVKRLEGPATPGGEAKTGVAQATPAPRAGGKKKAATETVRTDPETLLLWLRGLFTKCLTRCTHAGGGGSRSEGGWRCGGGFRREQGHLHWYAAAAAASDCWPLPPTCSQTASDAWRVCYPQATFLTGSMRRRCGVRCP